MMNPAYRVRHDDGYEDDIDPLDLAPLESSLAPIVTVPAEAEEEAEDTAMDEGEPEDGSVPSLETDLSSDDDQINIPGIEGRSSSLRDHVDHEDQDCRQPFDEGALTPPHLPSIWDPPERHGAQLYEFLHSTREEILNRLFIQVLRMMRNLGDQRRLGLAPEYEVLSKGLSLLMLMGDGIQA